MRAWMMRTCALATAALALCGAAKAAPPDISGVWATPFRVHSSGLPLMAGATQWAAVSKGDPSTMPVPTLDQLSAIADESVRTHNGVPVFGGPHPAPPPFTPAGQAAFAAIDPKVITARELGCYPLNIVSRDGTGPVQIVVGRNAVTMINEAGLGRTIFLDGRSEVDALPQWSGHSVGHWDGDVLKVRTTNIRGDVFGIPIITFPMDENTVLDEEYRMSPDGKHLTLLETVNDPTFYKESLRRMVYMNRVNEEVTDYTCSEGREDLSEVGKAGENKK